MDFFKIINTAFTVVAWLIVLAVVWALFPYFTKLLQVVQTIHDFAK